MSTCAADADAGVQRFSRACISYIICYILLYCYLIYDSILYYAII